MDALRAFLDQGWVGATIGVTGIIIGAGFSIYSLLHRARPKLSYQYSGQRLIDGGEALLPENVLIQYNGKLVTKR